MFDNKRWGVAAPSKMRNAMKKDIEKVKKTCVEPAKIKDIKQVASVYEVITKFKAALKKAESDLKKIKTKDVGCADLIKEWNKTINAYEKAVKARHAKIVSQAGSAGDKTFAAIVGHMTRVKSAYASAKIAADKINKFVSSVSEDEYFRAEKQLSNALFKALQKQAGPILKEGTSATKLWKVEGNKMDKSQESKVAKWLGKGGAYSQMAKPVSQGVKDLKSGKQVKVVASAFEEKINM